MDLKLIIQNLTPTPAHIYGGTNSVDFAITNKADENVWYWQCGKVNQMDLRSQNVSPSEPLEFTGHWEQIDTKGYPVPPGVYLIKGVLDTEYPEKLNQSQGEMRRWWRANGTAESFSRHG